MKAIYINYPNPHITLHLNPNCGRIKSGGRLREIRSDTDVNILLKDISSGTQGELPFTAKKYLNGLWVHIINGNLNGIANSIQKELMKTYNVHNNFEIRVCCNPK
jgi:hypothetical protein